MAEAARSQSIEPQENERALGSVSWAAIREAGCYVDVTTGELFRIPQEAIVQGASPMIRRESQRASRLLLLSRDPYEITLALRLASAENNVRPAF